MATEPKPYVLENATGSAPIVIVVDHASNAIPDPWGDLGLGPDARQSHIAWDPGALPVARDLARRLDAPLFAATVSRLVLDLNRTPGSATLIPEVSETTAIPGNRAVGPDERRRRIEAVYEPYHAGLEDLIAAQARRCAGPLAIVAIHTFTPVFKGVARDLDVGVLFGPDDRFGRRLLADLQSGGGLKAEANKPYSPADEVYATLDRHAVSHGHLNAMIEIRNDRVAGSDDQTVWAERLEAAIRAARAACTGPDRFQDRTRHAGA